MKKIIVLVAAIAMCCAAYSQGQVQERDYVEVNARAWREVNPDEIYLHITLDQNDTKGKYTIVQLEKQLYDALKRAGINAEKDLMVSDISSDIKSFLLRRNEGRTTKEYVLKCDNTHLMPVFTELDKAGISHVEMQNTRYSKRTELYEELLGEAVATAKRRADIMAQAAGQKVGKMIFVQNYDSNNGYETMARNSNMVMAYSKAEAVSDAVPVLEMNKIRIEVNVTVRFAL